MHSNQRKLPLEVSSWMEKDLTLRKITANSRLLTNDTRQNIVLGRQFFADLLNLSFVRYRTMAEYDFDKRMFLKNQQRKSDSSMPGLRPYTAQLTYNMNRLTTSRRQSSRKGDNPFMNPSTQSFFSRPETKSEQTFDRRQQSSIRQIQTAHIRKPRPDITPVENSTTATNQRHPTSRKMSRERLNRLAQPKGYRFKSPTINYIRSNTSEETETAEEAFAKIDETLQETSQEISLPKYGILPGKTKSAVQDKRFSHLMDVFCKVHAAQKSDLPTFKTIVQNNTSLQDDEGHWKTEHPSVSRQKTELKQHRQMLADKMHKKLDIFLIDVRT